MTENEKEVKTESKTEQVIKGMLTENTGSHFLDSGGAYGRNWQYNQGRNFDAEPNAVLKFSTYNSSKGTKTDISVTLNAYHWLKERLEFNAELDNIFHGRFRKERDSDNKSWLELLTEFPEYLAQLHTNDNVLDSGEELKVGDECPNCKNGTLTEGENELCCGGECGTIFHSESGELRFGEFGGIYGEGEPVTDNSYNHENLLSQTIQYTLFCGEYGEFVALQIHGGCDVRGGYTKPRIFSFGNRSEYDIIDYARANIYCTGKDRLPEAEKFFEKRKIELSRRVLPGLEDTFGKELEETRTMLLELENSNNHHWSTDDSCHWYFQGSCGAGSEPQLEKYEVVDFDDEDNEFNVEVDETSDTKEQTWEPGKLCIKDGDGYCPYCGAKLAASD